MCPLRVVLLFFHVCFLAQKGKILSQGAFLFSYTYLLFLECLSTICQTFKQKLGISKLKKYLLKSQVCKVEKILKGSLDSIPSPSPSVKIQIMGGKVCLRCKGKTLLSDVNKLFVFKSLLTMPGNVLSLRLKQTFPPII